jgi:RNA recognition motif-containing protein
MKESLIHCYGNSCFKQDLSVRFEIVDLMTVVNVHIPRDRVTSMQQGFGFVEFSTEEDADYATKVMVHDGLMFRL